MWFLDNLGFEPSERNLFLKHCAILRFLYLHCLKGININNQNGLINLSWGDNQLSLDLDLNRTSLGARAGAVVCVLTFGFWTTTFFLCDWLMLCECADWWLLVRRIFGSGRWAWVSSGSESQSESDWITLLRPWLANDFSAGTAADTDVASAASVSSGVENLDVGRDGRARGGVAVETRFCKEETHQLFFGYISLIPLVKPFCPYVDGNHLQFIKSRKV